MHVVVFDLDDTLYNEVDFLKSAFREIARILTAGRDDADFVYNEMLSSYSRGANVFDELIQHYKPAFSVEELLQLYRNHKPLLSLDECTRNALCTLKDAGCVLGLITDGRTVTQKHKIASLKLHEFIDESDIIISELFGTEKPNEKNYRYFSEKYGYAQYYYVGDNVKKDFITPNLLGWITICVKDNGQFIHKQNFDLDKNYLPQYTIEHIGEVYSIVHTIKEKAVNKNE